MAAVYIGEETVPKNLVGSIKSGTVNYIRDMKAFDPQLIPPDVRSKVQAVKQFVEKDMLGTRSKEWTTSTYVDRMRPYARQVDFEAWKFQTRAGLRDEHKPRAKDPREFTGCETRNDYQGWNVSNEISQRELKRQLAALYIVCRTDEYHRLARSKSAKVLAGYKNPVRLQNEFSQSLRRQKEVESTLRDTLRKVYVYDHPTASSAKISANVFRLAEITKLKQRQAELYSGEVISKFRPDMTKTLTSRRLLEYSHNGVWKLYELTGKNCWSCCLSEQQDSQGCVVKVRDSDRWNLEGFTSS